MESSMGSRSWPLGVLYPAAGVAVAVFIGAGLLVMRSALDDPQLLDAYLVMAVGLSFAVCGRVLGRREDALSEASLQDSLTSLGNRRSFEKRMKRELRRAVETDMPLSLLALDVDPLKRLDDRNGHDAGDEALRLLGEVLRATCRSRDLPAHFGGDAFVVVMPRTSAQEAAVLAERVRARFRRAADDTLAPEVAASVSVSIGAADLACLDSREPGALFAAADRALYLAKSGGRDRVVLFEADPVTVEAIAFPARCTWNEDEVAVRCQRDAACVFCPMDVNVRAGFGRVASRDAKGISEPSPRDSAIVALRVWGDVTAENG